MTYKKWWVISLKINIWIRDRKVKKNVCYYINLGIVIGLINCIIWSVAIELKVEAKITAKVDNFSYSSMKQIPSTSIPGIGESSERISDINEFWGINNQYNIAYSGDKFVYISILNQNMILQKTLEIKKDLPLVGNVIQDKKGNYYIVFGKNDDADIEKNQYAGSAIVMSVVKYDSSGKMLKKVSYKGSETKPFEEIGEGTKLPFLYGNCDIIIDKKGVLVCRYSRLMYNGFSSSHALYIDIGTMSKLNYVAPINSATGQKVIATTDGSYLMAESRYSGERGVTISRINPGSLDLTAISSFTPFHYRNGSIYHSTYAAIGGIIECTNGYALSGVSEKTLSYTMARDAYFNEPRNLFLQVFSKDFTSESTNKKEVQLLQGDTRLPNDTYIDVGGGCEVGAKDYGVLWLTDYTGKYYASNPKMISMGEDKLLVMWEKKLFTIKEVDQYITSYYMVVSSTGEIVIPETEMQGVKLTAFGKPTYRNGYAYWTTSDGNSNTFEVHRLTIGETMVAFTKVEALSIDKTDIIIRAGQVTKLNIKVQPEDADNKKLIYSYDGASSVSINENGYVTVLTQGSTQVAVWAEDNPEAKLILNIVTTDNTPKNLKAKLIYKEDKTSVKLTWAKTALYPRYDIYRSTNKNIGFIKIGSTDNCEYYDTLLKSNKTYYYQVKSSNFPWTDEKNCNPFSNIVSIYILPQ
jgi:hypothetical protein